MRECEALVRTMVASMEHEPFCISGVHFASEIGVYAGWVAHEKSFASDQVFFNEERDVALLLSGECFSDSAVVSGLRQEGHAVGSGRGDWLVHSYEESLTAFFERLNGLFSGLLIDLRERKAFLFNDRYGVERLYWHEADDATYFASEAKALLRVLPELRVFDEEGVSQFLQVGYTLGQRTLFRGISTLPGASLWTYQDGICRKNIYFSPSSWESSPVLSSHDFEARFQEIFNRILPRYFDGESRIGISLTAGLDTRMIVACRPWNGAMPECYTFSGERQDTLDATLSARVARECGLEHHILRIRSDFFSSFARYADRTVYLTDGCLGAVGAHELYMNEQARRFGSIRVTGNYGSEILRGVSTLKPLRLASGLTNPDWKSPSVMIPTGEHPVTCAAFREIPWKRFGVQAAGASQVAFRTPYLDNEIVALAYRMPSHSRTSPLPALRFVRHNSPALGCIPTDMAELGESHRLAATARKLFSKATFKLDYLYNEGFPNWLSPFESGFRYLSSGAGILGLHKHLHYRAWFRRELSGYVEQIVTDPQTHQMSFWSPDFLRILTSDHIKGRRNYINEIDAVLTLEAIDRLLFRDLPVQGPAISVTALERALVH